MAAGVRLGVDIGGTFTDLVLTRPDGTVLVSKVSSTPDDPGRAVVTGVAALLRTAGIAPADVVELVHGTTVASNTILQKKGARTGLLTTRGFRDVLEIGRIRTPDLFDLTWEKPVPLVERRWRADPARRILFGQSRGGSFVLYSAFTEPDLFWARIASNPAFEPGRARFFGPPPAATRTDLRLIVSSGTNDRPHLRAAALDWFRHWEGRAAPWTIRAQNIAGGTHAADVVNVYREALRWLFPAPPPAAP